MTRANSATLRRVLGTALLGASLIGLSACGGGGRPRTELAAAQLNTIGVNAYLWRASLETVSFAPLLQADSAGGVIVTDWYTNPSNPTERATKQALELYRAQGCDGIVAVGGGSSMDLAKAVALMARPVLGLT